MAVYPTTVSATVDETGDWTTPLRLRNQSYILTIEPSSASGSITVQYRRAGTSTWFDLESFTDPAANIARVGDMPFYDAEVRIGSKAWTSGTAVVSLASGATR